MEADYLICVAPFGLRTDQTTSWRAFETAETWSSRASAWGDKTSTTGSLQFDRAEPWTVANFWPSIRKRAVFVVSPGVLFAKGQEERLRERLVEEGVLERVARPTRYRARRQQRSLFDEPA